MTYNVKPIEGPQGLFVPNEGLAYIAASGVSNRVLICYDGGNLTVPYSIGGVGKFETTGVWSNPDLIYMFGNPDPILLRSPDGGSTQSDIKPAAGDPLRPVLALPWKDDDLLVITSGGKVKYRDIDTWEEKGDAPIEPECGMRSRYGGIQILLGQKQAGEIHKVAFSPNLGEDWEDMSTGLPDMKVTSIVGLEGSGDWKPSPEIAPPCLPYVQLYNGHYWKMSADRIFRAGTIISGSCGRGEYYKHSIPSHGNPWVQKWEMFCCDIDYDHFHVNFKFLVYCPLWDIKPSGYSYERPRIYMASGSTLESVSYPNVSNPTAKDMSATSLGNGWWELKQGNCYGGGTISSGGYKWPFDEPYLTFSIGFSHTEARNYELPIPEPGDCYSLRCGSPWRAYYPGIFLGELGHRYYGNYIDWIHYKFGQNTLDTDMDYVGYCDYLDTTRVHLAWGSSQAYPYAYYDLGLGLAVQVATPE